MRFIFLIAAVLLVVFLILIVEVILAYSLPKGSYKNPDNEAHSFGTSGFSLSYVILGDSTSAGDGAEYKDGIAIGTSEHLAKTYQVSMTNFSISGDKTQDIIQKQLSRAAQLKPDLVLVSIGANDVTNRASAKTIEKNMNSIISTLLKSNCNTKIVLTAAPDLGASPRLLQPLRYIVGLRAAQINKTFYKIVQENNLTLAPIAEKTGAIFRKDQTLFAPDKYHPNARGYAVWLSVLNPALDEALRSQPSHCQE